MKSIKPTIPKTVPKTDGRRTEDGRKTDGRRYRNKNEKNVKKESALFVLPSWIPPETWQAYMAVRIKKRAAQTPYAFNLIIAELEKIKAHYGQDPIAVLNKSITSGWTDVYPLKENGEPNRQGASW